MSITTHGEHGAMCSVVWGGSLMQLQFEREYTSFRSNSCWAEVVLRSERRWHIQWLAITTHGEHGAMCSVVWGVSLMQLQFEREYTSFRSNAGWTEVVLRSARRWHIHWLAISTHGEHGDMCWVVWRVSLM